jgi:hypothetical protein
MAWTDEDETYESGAGDIAQLTEKEDVLGPLLLETLGNLARIHQLLLESPPAKFRTVKKRLTTLRAYVDALPTEAGAPVKPLPAAIGFQAPVKKKRPRSS